MTKKRHNKAIKSTLPCANSVKIVKFIIIICMSLGMAGCITKDASKWLSNSNDDFKFINGRQLYFTGNLTANADYLGKHDNKHVYMVKDLNGQKVFLSARK